MTLNIETSYLKPKRFFRLIEPGLILQIWKWHSSNLWKLVDGEEDRKSDQ